MNLLAKVAVSLDPDAEGVMFYIFGNCTLDTQRHELRRAGEPIKLTRKDYEVLLYLVQHSDHLVTKEELLEHVWPDVYVDDTAVARCIRTVRRAVGDSPETQHVIKTVHGQGYRFVAPLTVQEQLPTLPPSVPFPVVASVPSPMATEAAARGHATPFVGREEELSALRQRWERAKAGDGQVVLLNGEPGIGKSRLAQKLKEQAAQDGAACIEFRCLPYHQYSALFPVINHLQHLLQFAPDDAPPKKLEKLQAVLSRYRFPQAETLPLVAALLSLPHPPDAPPLTLSPRKQKQKLLLTLAAWLSEETAQQSVCSIWEDLQWADPSTLELLTLYLDQVPTARTLVLMTFRPEFAQPWGLRSYFQPISLGRLEPGPAETMITHLLGEKTLPPAVLQQIATKTDGVPLFIEELSKMVAESDLQVGTTGQAPLPLAIPATLHEVLMARLDRLAQAKEIAQVGAILGRDFSYDMLRALAPVEEEQLHHGLGQLVEAELLYQRGLPPHVRYIFKHALVQETAYQSLPASQRQLLHRHAAELLEQQLAKAVETPPELVAHHYTEAGLIAQALPYWLQAGQRATQRSANREAIGHLQKGIALVQTLPDSPERARQELQLQIALGTPTMMTKGYAAQEAADVFLRVHELYQRVGDPPLLFPALWGLWAFYTVRGDHRRTRQFGQQILDLAQRLHNPVFLLHAHYALGASSFWRGDFATARTHLEEAITIYDGLLELPPVLRAAGDPGAACRIYLALVLWHLGYPAQALQRMQDAAALAHKLAHPFTQAYAVAFQATIHQFRDERQAALACAETAIATSTEQGFAHWLSMATMFHGWASAALGQQEPGLAEMRRGLAATEAVGAQSGWPYYLVLMADLYSQSGRYEEAQAALQEAEALSQQHEEWWWDAERYRIKGELLLRSRVKARRKPSRRQVGKAKVKG
jgi:DNA-binding winged helix-turn-helix (wHTH) protein/predicted ATPase